MSEKEESSKTPDLSLSQSITWFIRSDDTKSNKRNKTIPCGRWGHASASIDNNYYVYGGTGDRTSAVYWESIYKLDLETWEWTNLEAGNKPPTSRDSHSMTHYRNKLYIFGGSCDSESRNDLYEYDLGTGMWKQVEVKGSVPTPREGHSACLYDDKYLVIYGGWNGEETLNDCYLFDVAQSTWIKVEKNIGTEATPRESQSCCLLKDHMYIFGGQGNTAVKNGESVELFFNDLYKFRIIFEGGVAVASWEKLDPQGGAPAHRSSHSVSTYKDRYMFIVGGEGYPKTEGQTEVDVKQSKNKDDDYSCFPKNDVWFYDMEQNRWNNAKIKNGGEFFARFAHSCNTYKDYLVVFGGLRDYHHSTSDICVLSLDGNNPLLSAKVQPQPNKAKKETKPAVQEQEKEKDKDKLKAQPGGKGAVKGKGQGEFNLLGPTHHGGHAEQNKEAVDESITELDGPLVSTSFLHSLSSIISWPLAAFGLLLDNALINRAANMKIDVLSRKRKSQEMPGGPQSMDVETSYLVIEDDGRGWKHNDFINIFMKYDTDPTDSTTMILEEIEGNPLEEERRKRINEYAFNLKVAGFRLGRTIIYISRCEDEVSIGFISVDKRYNPDVHGNHVFLYSWKRSTMEFLTSQAQKNKYIIMNALAGYFTEEDFLHNIDKVSNRVFILDLNPVVMSKSVNGKSQDCELLFPKKGPRANDILIRTLDNNLTNFYTDQTNSLIELSLRTYFSHFFLDPGQANIEIVLNENPILFMNLKEVTEDKSNQSSIQKVKEEGLFDAYFLQPDLPKDPNKEQKDLSGAAGNKRKSKQKSYDKRDFNQGVLIYYGNRLIRRLETPKLGNLDFLSFQSRQVLNKQNAGSLFNVNGYIEVKSCLKPNMFKTEIENPYYANYLYSTVIPKIQELNVEESDKRKNEVPLDEFETVSKKVKANPVT